MKKEMQKETNRPMAKILSQGEIDRALRVVDENVALVNEVRYKGKFEKRLLTALDERFVHIRQEIDSLNEAIDELQAAFSDIEERLESANLDSGREIKRELREIKEALKSIKADTKYLKISKSAEEAAPYYKNELPQEENKALKSELTKSKESAGFTKNEMVDATILAEDLDCYMDKLKSKELEKIAVIQDDKPKVVILPIDRFEEMVALCVKMDF